MAAALVGCSAEPVSDADAGPERDATLADAPPIVPDASTDGSAPSDAAPVDAAPACAMGECDPRMPGGCESGLSCVLADRMPACAMGTLAIAAGEPCTAETDCAPGLACFQDGASGVCAPVCCPGDPAACGADRDAGPSERCSADGVLVNGVATSWGRCAPPRACDPRMPECAPREGCYIRYPDRGAECRFAGTAELGEECVRPEDCLPGFHCAGIDRRTCVRVCDLGDARSCPDGEGACVAQAYSPEGTGVCVLTMRAW